MKKILGSVAAAGALALLAACGQAPATSGEGASTTASASGSGASFKGCIVSDGGGFKDQSFNQAGLEGLEKAKSEDGIQIASVESKSDADYAPNIATLVSQNCNLVVASGFLLADALGQQADANKDTQFAIVDSTVTPARDNVKPLLFDTAQAAYLAGYVAAGMSKTGTVATYGGIKIPSVTIFMDGFSDGVAKYNQDKGKAVKVLGWDKATQDGSFTGDFTDATKGRNTSQNFIDQGADIILPVAGPVGSGTLAAAKAANDGGKDVKVIWVDSDGYNTQPDYRDIILTTVVKEIGTAVQAAVKSELDGTFSSQPYVGTLDNGGVSLAPFHDLDSQVPQELKTEVTALQEQIASGAIKVESQSTP
ncbi:nucleoside-binding protein [Quadrisphaera granulorum]|uniref:Nucleoside-binding protein n=1 Tax=Quadrisphaera granulorum TaxID=317664 RepID=A0A315ZPS2_9ACTN|nr:BMP family ABC transporter substrate-binding protein [Quadrisphaera granulorum]PWJ47292.1 nucleoside-binding protein [Quadrisphaera granulorum]SZE98863.1 nucleoside-binding protein [Quadrisphaera granulorum]